MSDTLPGGTTPTIVLKGADSSSIKITGALAGPPGLTGPQGPPGSSGSSFTTTAVKNSNYTAAPNDYIPVDTTSGAVTITLPNAPVDKTIIGVKHILQGGTNIVTINTSGSDVFNKIGGGTSITLTLLSQGVLLQYTHSTGIWYVQSDDLPLGQLDARYASSQPQLIDLCRAPYGLVPGADITSTLQSAINTLVVPGSSTIFYFSKTGNYNINGAQQTGTVGAYTYSGQIVLPALPWSGAPAYVCIQGLAHPDFYTPINSSTVITSNATSGNILSIIPNSSGTYPGHSNISVEFCNLAIMPPNNPQCGGLDLRYAWQRYMKQVVMSPPSLTTAASLTGTGAAVWHTTDVDGSGFTVRDCVFDNWPIGIKNAEQLILHGDVFFTMCAAAIGGHNTACAYFHRLYAMGCGAVFSPDSTLTIEGLVGVEKTGATGLLFANDPNGYLRGTIEVYLSGNVVETPTSLFSNQGDPTHGSKLNIKLTNGPQAGGILESHPFDNFTRLLPASSPPTGVPGLCSHTWHPWRVSSGTFAVSSNVLSVVSGPASAFLPVRRAAQGGESRSITAVITTASSGYDVSIIGHQGYGVGNRLSVRLFTSTLYINYNGAFQVFSIVPLAVNTTYTVTLEIIVNSIGLPIRARALLNGVPTLEYVLTAAQTAALAPSTTWPLLEDGISIDANGSTVSGFYVRSMVENKNIPIVAKSVPYTITYLDSTVLVSGTTTITLPTAIGIAGTQYTIKKTDSGTTSTIATTSSQTIDGSTTASLLVQYISVTVQSDGANWNII